MNLARDIITIAAVSAGAFFWPEPSGFFAFRIH